MRLAFLAVIFLVGVAVDAEKSLGEAVAEKSLVDELSDEAQAARNGNLLGEAAAETDTEFLDGLLKSYDKENWKNFISLEAQEENHADRHHDDPPRFIRHLDTAMVMTTVSNRRDQQDAAWLVRPALCPPGDASKKCPAQPDGAANCFSLESVNYKGFFLSKSLNEEKVEVRAATPAQEAMQTVCARAGLADPKMITLEFLASSGKFISNRNSLLRLCSGADDGTKECGKVSSADFNRMSTFKHETGKFVGQCNGPEKIKECACLNGWLGRHCNSQCPGSSKLGICNGHGACDLNKETKAAQCQCKDGWLGLECTDKCPVRNGQVCSGTAAGKCYNDPQKGPSCRCRETRLGELCEFTCPGVKDPNANTVCNGHGKCKMNEPGDAAMCECKKGFLGDECDKGCPVADGHICGGFGRCEIDKFGQASCQCSESRRGKACELRCPRDAQGLICSQNGACVVANGKAVCACEDGFLGERCQHKCPGVIEGAVCSGHGKCNVAANKHGVQVSKCICDKTHGGKDCLLPCPTDDQKNPCSGHGTCEAMGKCACKPGFLGKSCQHDCPHVEGDTVCHGHGKCEEPAAEGSPATCKCDFGFQGASCKSECPKNDGVICAGRGKCQLDKLSSQTRCVCKTGSLGPACQFKCPGSLTDHVCSGHGKCHLFPNNESPVGAVCGSCTPGFVGKDCGLRCPGLGEDGKACSGHGKCMKEGAGAVCKCDDGFMGPGCNHQCPTDKAGRACSAEGICKLAGDFTTCSCKAGFLGQSCQFECPRNTKDKAVCSGRGDCQLSLEGDHAECKCGAGSVGKACDTGCPIGGNKLACSGHGECKVTANAGGCKCMDGWTGASCGNRQCTAANAVFNKVTGQCVCPAGNICCKPKDLKAKQEKESRIMALQKESSELQTMIQETETMMAKRRLA